MSNPGIPFTVLAFLLVIGPLIFVHELGHYFAGRWFGVKADTFSIGFGREITGWTDRRGTRWKVGWLPLGGYVKFAGDMNPASTPSDEWLSLPAAERAQHLPGEEALAALHHRRWPGRPPTSCSRSWSSSRFSPPTASRRTPPIIGVDRATVRRRRPPASRPATESSPSTAARVDRFEDIALYVAIRPEQHDAFRRSSAAARRWRSTRRRARW